MLRIAVNTRLLLKSNMEGIGRYTYEVFSRIVTSHPEHRFYFIFDRPYDKKFIFSSNVTPVVVPPPVRHPVLARTWFDFTLRQRLKQLKPDLFFSPDAMNSLKPVCKTITVLHDINFETHPEFMSPMLRRYYRRRTPVIARQSDKILTVSNYSKEAIVKTYHLPADHVEVVYNAVSSHFKPTDENCRKEVRQKYTRGLPYFVYVGGFYRRKNLLNLVKAYEIFREQSSQEVLLVMVGQLLKDANPVLEYCKLSKYSKDMIIPGRIDDDAEVNEILGSSLALTYVSTVEGFGLPIAEAMKCEVPVITSNTTCMPEIAGEAGLFVDPFNPEDIAEKMLKLTNDEALRQELIDVAKERSRLFDWDDAARRTWEIIEKVING